MKTIHRKRDAAPSVLKCLTLEVIAAKYPPTKWLHNFTDGSQFECHFKVQYLYNMVGDGVFSNLLSFYAPTGYIGTSFDGELVAIYIALKQLLAIHYKFAKAVIFSDSQAAIRSISSVEHPLTLEILQCQELLRTLTLKGKQIVLQWAPAYCGLWGNEQENLLTTTWPAYYNILMQPFLNGELNFLESLFTSNILRDLQTRTAL
ncbi:uncharacterized protein LOC118183170 [Stegodyphus dumicola]|uniref:uncharacterized protein LOC118183170 n=1 Tax=Stegodyphus dumicola TaxID=202533 RepID=UPI0015AF5FA4|nr:uncharacterized protein LOC118183170 [Stegodyphus dumicola]